MDARSRPASRLELTAAGLGAARPSWRRGAEGQVSLLECHGRRYAVKQPFAVDAGFADLAAGEEVVRREAALPRPLRARRASTGARAGRRPGRAVPRAGARASSVGDWCGSARWVDGAAPRADFVPGLHATELGTLLGRLHAAAPDDRTTRSAGGTAPCPEPYGLGRPGGREASDQPWRAALAARLADLDAARRAGARLPDRAAALRGRPPRPAPRQRPGDRGRPAACPSTGRTSGRWSPTASWPRCWSSGTSTAVEVDAPAVRRDRHGLPRGRAAPGVVRGLEAFAMVLCGELNFLAQQARGVARPRHRRRPPGARGRRGAGVPPVARRRAEHPPARCLGTSWPARLTRDPAWSGHLPRSGRMVGCTRPGTGPVVHSMHRASWLERLHRAPVPRVNPARSRRAHQQKQETPPPWPSRFV